MAHHKSAKKRIRSDAVKRDRNRSYLSSVRTAVKSFRNAAEGGEQGENVQKLFVAAQKALTKAASKGILHKNNASRKVARLSAVLNKAQKGEFKADVKKK
ncbi:30S ribosomal protein S20 [Pseudobacteriovorax antillogorgiicola]|uniref:Small ribosomal subunit protein bS20 n=1 Tax=Pseudobacteriovorax antillogorgiicola TaxID=1513793 RepID=A0A1Y6B3T5_9BACT|nr:30S ribosomal protein S20 [Pseudobacteriovorax antillogorgiicola]TCS59409.1 SSU ribosomal protein S20P [Pseudobacteriovorax antillogorgiicola]SME88586.1 SSU ribosomal protein S20P [Pseudobacteriovorax antillogorgiicola]